MLFAIFRTKLDEVRCIIKVCNDNPTSQLAIIGLWGQSIEFFSLSSSFEHFPYLILGYSEPQWFVEIEINLVS